MTPSYTILFSPIESVGHFSACIGIGQVLKDRGHRVVFTTPNSWKGKLELLGFVEELYQDEVAADDKWGSLVATLGPTLAMPLMQKVEYFHTALFAEAVRKAKDAEHNLRQIVNKVKPDLIVTDGIIHSPALMDQGIPWILSTSLNPLGAIICKELPPGFAGYSILNGDPGIWKQYLEKHSQYFGAIFQDFQNWVVNNGGPKLVLDGSPYWLAHSPFANICMYPQEMCYSMHAPLPRKWYQFDAFVRKEPGTFEVPEELANLPGKLVYFSLGSIGSSELGLMRKCIEIMSKSPNRFIVSKGNPTEYRKVPTSSPTQILLCQGPLGEQLTLPQNMWGMNNLKQTLVLPKVDLVITHGGNNTVTETFYFGKPILVLPLFCDQLDNATRVHETGHGLRLEPYEMTEVEFLDAIEQLLGDNMLKRRMHSIGLRIRAGNNQSRAADLIESVATNNCRIR